MISYKLVKCFFRILKTFFLFTLWAFRMFSFSTQFWNVMIYLITCFFNEGFSDGTVIKNPSAHAGDARDAGLIPGSGRSPAVGNGNPLWCSCLENSMDRGAWQAKNWTRLSNWACRHTLIPRSGTAGSYGNSIFNLLRNCQTVFHSNCTVLHPTSTLWEFWFFSILAKTSFVSFCRHPTCHDCVSLIVNGVERLSLWCWPLVHFLWRWVYSSLCP